MRARSGAGSGPAPPSSRSWRTAARCSSWRETAAQPPLFSAGHIKPLQLDPSPLTQHTALPFCSSGDSRQQFGWLEQGNGLSRGYLEEHQGRRALGCMFDEHRERREMGKLKERPAEPWRWVSKHQSLQCGCLGRLRAGRRTESRREQGIRGQWGGMGSLHQGEEERR